MPEYSSEELQKLLEQAAQIGWDAAWDTIEPQIKKMNESAGKIRESFNKLEEANKKLSETLKRPWFE
jgi:hypothetical protein